MVVYVANPLYDAVFKYLMEDERIAKTILTALLKKKVVGVKIRRNEYANLTRRESISMFRIDFAATIQDEDGMPHLMLIELQKTWLPTETLRFRRYLALQYNNEENMLKEPQEQQRKYAIPMVAIYLLGHRVGNIKEPIIYVNHQAYDYDDNVVKDGLPDPFVESLQHNSIIVQLPLLKGRINNRLEQVLSVFDQTNVMDDKKVIRVDDQQFDGDNDMEYIVRRLQSAAADPEVRYQMNAEDEFFKEIEDRDTAIMERDEKLKEKESQIQEKESQIQEKESQIQEKESQIQEKESQIQEKESQLKEQNEMLKNMVEGMLQKGISVKEISEMTGLSEEKIQKLQ